MKFAFMAAALASSFTSFSIVAAEKLEDISLCYFPYREEMTTAALYTADKKGYFEQNGIKVHWKKDFPGAAPKKLAHNFTGKNNVKPTNRFPNELFLVDRLDAGECDVGSISFEAVVGSGLQSVNNLVPLAVYRYGKDYDTHLAVRKDLNLKNLSELKGKRIRASGIGVLVVMNEILKSADLKMNDVDLQLVDVPKLPEDFDNKKADVVLAYVPTVPLLIASDRVKILEKNVYSRYLGGLSIPHSMLIANRGFMNKREDVFKKFVAAFKKGAEEIKAHPENAVFGAEIIDYPTKTYTKANAEKSLNFFNVQLPMVYDTAGANFFKGAQFAEYQDKLVKEGYLTKAADLSPWMKSL